MNRITFRVLLVLLVVGLALTAASCKQEQNEMEPTTIQTQPAETEPETEPTETEPTETEPTEERFTLTFVGDCTLGSDPSHYGIMYSFIWTIGEDYDYPFRNVVQYFENDDFTIVNLEGTFCDEGSSSGAMFTFRGPTEYVNILTGSSVEAASFANNHTMDYRQAGYDSTLETLKENGIAYVERDSSTLVTTESGLTIGLYAFFYTQDVEDMTAEIAALREQGAEIVICSAHWGKEGSYRPMVTQKDPAHAAIDAGADIVYGHHPHVLQPIEEYGDGVIYYSMGNFCFGGNTYPKDLDSAILQQEVIRDPDGTVHLGERTIIPVSCSSIPVQNNFQPTPYEEGTKEYDRIISKLDGSWDGPDHVVDYG